MGKNQMRMNIQLDADSRGFKRSLSQTQRDLQQFKKQAGTGISRVVDMAGLGMVTRFGGLMRTGRQGPGMLKQLGGAASMSAMAYGNHRLAQRARGGMQERLQGRSMRQGKMAAGMLAGAAMSALPMVLASGVVASAVVALSVRAAMQNQKQLNQSAAQYSAPVTAMQARVDLFKQRMAMMRAKDPAYVEQQKQLMVSQANRSMAGTKMQGTDFATTAEIWWNRLVAAMVDQFTVHPFMRQARVQAIETMVEGGVK